MKTIKYNKLVRDKIPEIIKSNGQECTVEILSDSQYLEKLELKLDEELAEFHKDKNIEELADLLEVIYAIAQAKGVSFNELENIRIGKQRERGRFSEKILLKEVMEK